MLQMTMYLCSEFQGILTFSSSICSLQFNAENQSLLHIQKRFKNFEEVKFKAFEMKEKNNLKLRVSE